MTEILKKRKVQTLSDYDLGLLLQDIKPKCWSFDEQQADPIHNLVTLEEVISEASHRLFRDKSSTNEVATGQSVRIPTSENEAVLMALLGTQWLEQNAPHRLRSTEIIQ